MVSENIYLFIRFLFVCGAVCGLEIQFEVSETDPCHCTTYEPGKAERNDCVKPYY